MFKVANRENQRRLAAPGHSRHSGSHIMQRGAATITRAIAIPGPFYMNDRNFDPQRQQQLYPSNFVQFPSSRDEGSPKRTPPLVRVRLSVDYRVHSRQMLCVGGSHVPFGWSFLSIAKVPMSWNPEDIWAVEVELPAGTRVEYKYVILEEQDWTQQVNEDVEGKVEYTYRTSPQSSPPDVQHIVRQMAIVAWQPGPNRILQVPAEDELNQLEEGIILERLTPPPQSTAPGTLRRYGQQAVGKILNNTPFPPPSEASGPPRIEEVNGVWERLYIDDNGRPCMDRRDVWGKEPEPLGSDKRGGAK